MDALFGDLLLPPDRAVMWISFGVVILIGAMLILLFFGEYTPRARVTGWLSTQPGAARISSSQVGVVSNIHVVAGSIVQRGDPLVTLSSTHYSTKTRDVYEAVSAQLARRLESIQRQREAERALSEETKQKITKDLQDSKENIESLQRLKSLYEDRLKLVQADEERNKTLSARGLLPGMAYEKAQDATLSAQLAIQEVQQRLATEVSTFEHRDAERRAIPFQLNKRLAELQAQESDIDQKITEAQASTDFVVRSELEGEVTGLAINVGDLVSSGAFLMTVIPVGAIFCAEMLVPTRSAGFLKPGMDVSLRYDAFPFEKFGQHRGTITDIGRSVLSSDEQRGPIRLNEPAYVVKAALTQQTMSAYNDTLALRPGLTFKADIIQSRRRVIDWIFEPLYSLARPLRSS